MNNKSENTTTLKNMGASCEHTIYTPKKMVFVINGRPYKLYRYLGLTAKTSTTPDEAWKIKRKILWCKMWGDLISIFKGVEIIYTCGWAFLLGCLILMVVCVYWHFILLKWVYTALSCVCFSISAVCFISIFMGRKNKKVKNNEK